MNLERGRQLRDLRESLLPERVTERVNEREDARVFTEPVKAPKETRGHGAREFAHAVYVESVRTRLSVFASGNKNNLSVTRFGAILNGLLFTHIPVLQVTDGTAVTTIGDENHTRLGVKFSQTVLNVIIRDDSCMFKIGRYQALVTPVRFVAYADVAYATTMTAEMNPRGVDIFGPRANGQVVNLGEDSSTGRVTPTGRGIVRERANVVEMELVFEDRFHVANVVNTTTQTSVLGVVVVQAE
jgi:hypothetical protein